MLTSIAAVLILVFALYFPRHRRVDMLVGCIVLTVGVAAITLALSRTTTLGAGFGLGLLGVLSIIRLRSSEIDQQDVAYAFASLALGVLGGLSLKPWWVSAALCVAVVAAVFVGDHPALFRRYRHQVVVLDRAIADEAELREHVETLLGGTVHRMEVKRLDMVEQTTLVDVRYVLPRR
jgi:Domain of unknown function (DUF4956)